MYNKKLHFAKQITKQKRSNEKKMGGKQRKHPKKVLSGKV